MGAFLQYRCFCHWHLDQFPDEEEEASGFEEEGRLILYQILRMMADGISSTMVMMDVVTGAVNRVEPTIQGLDIRNVNERLVWLGLRSYESCFEVMVEH